MSPASARWAVLSAALVLSSCAAASGGERAACDPVQRPPLQAGAHLIGTQRPPVPYSSTPPTSGWHSWGTVDVDVEAGGPPLTGPEQVSVLEAGGVVVSYRGLSPDEVERLELALRDQQHDALIALTRYDELAPGQVALTAWGLLQTCEGVDRRAIAAFVSDHAADDIGVPGEHD